MAAAVGAMLAGTGQVLPAHAQIGQTATMTAGPVAGAPVPAPPRGVGFPHSMYAANVPLRIYVLGRLTLDFKGGINLTSKTVSQGQVVFEVDGFRMEADTSPSTPNSGMLISLTSNDTPAPPSVLKSNGAGGSEMLIHLNLNLEIIDKATGEMVQLLHTEDPAKYATLRAADVKTFPLDNQRLTLEEPISFLAEDGQAAGELERFDAIANHSTQQ
ncbi:hypothetical protein [Streptomyces cinereoruber]|uniref:hypothetical protein n=1 Tax=Streptomyces cinereoruber TaxID=67260 RepID=UPI00364DE986